MKRNSLILLIFFFAWSACWAYSDELKNILAKTNTMQASFEQFIINKNYKNQSHTIGKIVLSRPNQFRWEVTSPNQQLIIATSKQILIYDIDLEQITKNKVNLNQPDNPAMLLSGSLNTLDEMFEVTKINLPGAGNWFQLKPKKTNNSYQWIKLHFVNDEIIAMYVMDNLGQQIEINFENIITNAKVPSSTFTLKIPKNVDVIENS